LDFKSIKTATKIVRVGLLFTGLLVCLHRRKTLAYGARLRDCVRQA